MATATASSSASNYNYSSIDKSIPKFDEYRSRVMIGDLPADFLRIQITRAPLYDPTGMNAGGFSQLQQPQHNPNFLGHLTLEIAEAKFIKNFGPLGLLKMDPYVRIRIGHISYETPTATSGGKNPQWKTRLRVNLFRGMDTVMLEVFDERNFMEDEFIAECQIPIPKEVLNGETKQSWYPLLGRQNNSNEGDILVIMSFVSFKQPPIIEHQVPLTPVGGAISSPSNPDSLSSQQQQQPPPQQQQQQNQQSPTGSRSAIPKPPPPAYSQEDVKTLEEMFPAIDRHIILELLDQQNGNKDLVVNQLLQIVPE